MTHVQSASLDNTGVMMDYVETEVRHAMSLIDNGNYFLHDSETNITPGGNFRYINVSK